MEVYWFEQSQADVPAHNGWLSANEVVCLNAMRFAKRRVDWLLGRWTAKRALSIYLEVPSRIQVFKKMELRPAPTGSPEAYFGDQPAAVTISLSHRAGIAACAVAVAGVELGCDLEMVEPRSDAFVTDFFTAEEQGLIARGDPADRARSLALLWSGKESALKALHEGLRLDARSVVVRPSDAASDLHSWSPIEVRQTGRRTFHGWWQQADSLVRTVVAAPRPDPPIRLRIPECVPATASRCA